MFGLGAALGAVYVTEEATEFPLADCVVTALKIPQEFPLQPAPLSAQDSAVLGFEPGTGVRVATIVAVPPAGTLDVRHALRRHRRDCWRREDARRGVGSRRVH
ncbi:MAG: hypothetical protein AUG83_08945 [Acidobacteria bacterium 13_1_20CM_4_57_11]|nr:MAG: hypothetical protein AUI02_02600 [Acidobacteria bacterium 13_2_20CM_2_57_12]OLE14974.1 MAG: hypothetical protein AUG83_08945 [Acidobacteria bacterium 13_1_20CM_4_57_11]